MECNMIQVHTCTMECNMIQVHTCTMECNMIQVHMYYNNMYLERGSNNIGV